MTNTKSKNTKREEVHVVLDAGLSAEIRGPEVAEILRGHLDGFHSVRVRPKKKGRKKGVVDDAPRRGSLASQLFSIPAGGHIYVEASQERIGSTLQRCPHMDPKAFTLSAMIAVPRSKDLAQTAHITKVIRKAEVST